MSGKGATTQSMLIQVVFLCIIILSLIGLLFVSHVHKEHLHEMESAGAQVGRKDVYKETEPVGIPGSLKEPQRQRLRHIIPLSAEQQGEYPSLPSPQTDQMRIAFAITITKDGNFQDGAAVLAYSILKHSQSKLYDVSLIAFVHPNVKERESLKTLGFHVIEAPLPINITAIEGKNLREHINYNGCCGASELIKLTSYRLTQYNWVVHMDADTIVNRPLDDLFLDESFKDLSLGYTTDPNMATHKGEDNMPAQGGFLLIKPSEQDFRGIIRTLVTTEFKNGGGWNGSHIGWFWGGMTVQGILPYYYNRVSINPETPGKTRRKIIDRCIYNTMADTEECQGKTLGEVRSAHFTICQKPWTCIQWGGSRGICKMPMCNPLCKALHDEWFRLRREAEKYYGFPVVEDACSWDSGRSVGTYIPISMKNPSVGGQTVLAKQPIPDDSPGYFKPPKPESGYRQDTEEWDNWVGGHSTKPAHLKPKPKPKPKGKPKPKPKPKKG